MINENTLTDYKENTKERASIVGKPLVAIVGRQNVGKSTLLNRIVGKQVSIVQDFPGTTRDRLFADVTWGDREFTIVDTGGIELKPENSIARGVRQQAEEAMKEADVIVFLMDARSGLLPADQEIARIVRRTGKPVILTVNKVDNKQHESDAAEFYRLGLGEPLPVSAVHGRGTGDLLDRIVSLLPPSEPFDDQPELMKIAIVGRPNVGKSMLLNNLLGEERSIVSEIPGTTRDAIDTVLDFDGQNIIIIDTAGIRKRGKIEAGIEWYSVIRSLRAIDRADVSLMVLDATEMVTDQDAHIAGYIQKANKGVILVVNKWDLVTSEDKTEYVEYIYGKLKFLPYVPIMFVSALTGQGVKKLMPQACQIFEERKKRIPDDEVNAVIQQAAASHSVPRSGNKELSIYSALQSGVTPPSFIIEVNDPKLVHFSYKRYLENSMRRSFGFIGTPILLSFKSRR